MTMQARVKESSRVLLAWLVMLTFLFTVAQSVSGCAQLGVPAPQTLEQKLFTAQTTINGINSQVAALTAGGAIKPDDARNILASTDNASAGVTIARNLRATDPSAADSRLQAVIIGLTAIQAYLTQRQGAAK